MSAALWLKRLRTNPTLFVFVIVGLLGLVAQALADRPFAESTPIVQVSSVAPKVST